MSMNEYQQRAAQTAIYPSGSFSYLALGLNGEAGEVAEIVKRSIRKQEPLTEEQKEKLILELGDCLWYIANLARELNVDLSEIAKRNIDKLTSRKERSKIEGNGDFR